MIFNDRGTMFRSSGIKQVDRLEGCRLPWEHKEQSFRLKPALLRLSAAQLRSTVHTVRRIKRCHRNPQVVSNRRVGRCSVVVRLHPCHATLARGNISGRAVGRVHVPPVHSIRLRSQQTERNGIGQTNTQINHADIKPCAPFASGDSLSISPRHKVQKRRAVLGPVEVRCVLQTNEVNTLRRSSTPPPTPPPTPPTTRLQRVGKSIKPYGHACMMVSGVLE